MSEGADFVIVAIRFLVAAVALAAGASKLAARHDFVSVIERYRLLPSRVARAISIFLPPVEVAAAVALVRGMATRSVADVDARGPASIAELETPASHALEGGDAEVPSRMEVPTT